MKTNKAVYRFATIMIVLVAVLVVGCGDPAAGGSSCSGSTAQGWSGFVAHKDLICLGSMEGNVIAFNPADRAAGKALPAEDEWVYTMASSYSGVSCSSMLCSPTPASYSGGIYSSPAEANDLVYVGTYKGKIYAFTGDKGKLRWVYPRESLDTVDAIVGNLISDGKSLYFGSSNGKIYSLDAVTGDLNWVFQSSGKIWTSPVADKAVIYTGNYEGNVYALSAGDGKVIWEVKLPAAIASSVVADKDSIYFGTFDRYLYALDKANGLERWKFRAGNWFWASPLVKDNVIYAACMDNKLYAVDAREGKELWQFDAGSAIVSAPVEIDTKIFIINDKGLLQKLDEGSGKPVSSVSVGFTVFAPLFAEGNTIYIYARDHNVSAVDAEKMEIIWKFSSKL